LQEAKEFGLQLPLPFLPKGRKEIDHFGMMNQQRPSLCCSYTNHQHVRNNNNNNIKKQKGEEGK
jgi:hypothetical protein